MLHVEEKSKRTAAVGDQARVALLSALVGMACWWVGLRIRPGETPLDGGPVYLFVLGGAGLLVSLLEGRLSWAGLLGLYGGQVAAMGSQAILGDWQPEIGILAWQPVFIVSVTLVAAVGGVCGAALAEGLRRPPALQRGAAPPPAPRKLGGRGAVDREEEA
jgi:hypothetical protein